MRAPSAPEPIGRDAQDFARVFAEFAASLTFAALPSAVALEDLTARCGAPFVCSTLIRRSLKRQVSGAHRQGQVVRQGQGLRVRHA